MDPQESPTCECHDCPLCDAGSAGCEWCLECCAECNCAATGDAATADSGGGGKRGERDCGGESDGESDCSESDSGESDCGESDSGDGGERESDSGDGGRESDSGDGGRESDSGDGGRESDCEREIDSGDGERESDSGDGERNSGDGDGERESESNGGDATEEKRADAGAEPPCTQELTLTDDPLEALAVNDSFRRADSSEAGLWSIGQWAPRQYKFGAPTFIPQRWPTAKPLTQEEYSRRFAAEFPEVAKVLPIKNICVAGGAAAWAFGDGTATVGDVDLFVVGVDPNNRAALWNKVAEVVRKLRRAFLRDSRRAAFVIETLTPGVITLVAKPLGIGGAPIQKVQIILRAFPSVSSLLHGFDIPACCVAYDGRATRMTYLAAWALAFRVNIVNPRYRSTTYERRLKKYFDERGFALALPHLRRGAFVADAPLQLPHLTLLPSIVRGIFVVGAVALPDGADAPSSDYDPSCHDLWDVGNTIDWSTPAINFNQLAAGENRFVVMSAVGRRRDLPSTDNKGLPFAEYARREPQFADILPRAAFEDNLRRVAQSILDRRGRIDVQALRRVYRFSVDEVVRFTAVVCEAASRNPGRRLDVAPALARHRAALVAAYDSAPADIEWWVTVDPSRQYTASLNPRIEAPGDWYGAACAEEVRPPTADEYVEALIATLEWRQGAGRPVYDGMCAFCFEPLACGAANSVILACGHIFHWSLSVSGCGGLYRWIDEHNNCPTCRHDLSNIDGISPPRLSPVPLAIEW